MNKGYYFILDGILAVFIITAGYLLIANTKDYSSLEGNSLMFASDVASFMASVRVNELCTGCDCSNGNLSMLCSTGRLTNPNSSIFQAIGELLSKNNYADARNLTQSIIDENRFDEFKLAIVFKSDLDSYPIYGNASSASLRTPVDRLVFSYYNETLGERVSLVSYAYVARVIAWK